MWKSAGTKAYEATMARLKEDRAAYSRAAAEDEPRRLRLKFVRCSYEDPLPPWECTLCGCMVAPRMMEKHREVCADA